MAKKYYGVKAGRNTGIYKTWPECEKQVKGYKGALYKSFPEEWQAREYVYGTITGKSDLPEAADVIDNQDKIDGKHYDIYVDGSYDNTKKKYSWGFAVYNGSEVIYTDSGIGKNSGAVESRNVAGELEAAMEAVKWAETQDIDTIIIHHDYAGISKWALGEWKTNKKLTQDYACFINPHLHWVKFNKVTGHTGIAGNELADKLAGEALKKEHTGK